VQELKYAIGRRVAEVRAGALAPPVEKKRAASPRKAKKKAEATRRVSKQAAFKKRQRR
jgi:hypothetical protein